MTGLVSPGSRLAVRNAWPTKPPRQREYESQKLPLARPAHVPELCLIACITPWCAARSEHTTSELKSTKQNIRRPRL
eukprot:CAMPEP_0204427980 /NCGR_PEP_ID=MMETSP0470-20130426/56599_1 /ASSEMBLY_ACC=CAM_ASM_000385 /TAXON_ID=2969 /ORGANISM="Oxyrrhis marina" /LENGTH=76 /DNA_ID=CAMNT_0051425839 /DNA_START=74 /DNA_END=301 /DNA_ORIENTATION=+